ncbi:MAG TPA: GNAT family N-acetyltransferase [Fimbriiglobus sp.]|nr:GNAT family N-acetyltransferase [Fimbriiglobus sp.]
MQTTDPFPSIAAVGEGIGRISERHWDRFVRLMLRGPMADRDERFVRLVTGAPHPFANLAVVCKPDDLESTKAAMQTLRTCGAPAALNYTGRVPTPVHEYLVGQGFEPHAPLVAMAVDIDRLADTSLPEGYSYVRIGPGPECATWASCFATGFGFPPILGDVFSPAVLGPNPTAGAPAQFFAIVKDGRPVCTTMLYLENGVAGIYCVATVPEERGKGLGAHAASEPLRLARKLGYRVGILQATEVGHPIYLRLGYQDVGEVPVYVRMPGP